MFSLLISNHSLFQLIKSNVVIATADLIMTCHLGIKNQIHLISHLKHLNFKVLWVIEVEEVGVYQCFYNPKI